MNYSEQVLPLFRQTRGILMPHWGKAQIINQKESSPVTIVTELDGKIEEFMFGELAKLYPEITFVGEENGGDRSAKKFWLMDPIDGTQHFVRGLPFCTSMLALIEDGQVVFAAIYDFINDIMYHAEKGKGAFKNDEKISVSNRSLNQSYLGWETKILKKEENKKNYLLLLQKAILFKTIACGWEFAMIAEGKLDGRVCFDPLGKDYDYAPGTLLVSEAGGIVKNIGSTEYDYRNTNFICANPIIYNELVTGVDAIFPI